MVNHELLDGRDHRDQLVPLGLVQGDREAAKAVDGQGAFLADFHRLADDGGSKLGVLSLEEEKLLLKVGKDGHWSLHLGMWGGNAQGVASGRNLIHNCGNNVEFCVINV